MPNRLDLSASEWHSHAPSPYACPFCEIILNGVEREGVVTESETALALMSLHQHNERPGSVLVVPKAHVENIYNLPDELAGALFRLTRRIAWAQKAALGCDGVTVRQHNEPAGGQDVWHLHIHVIPRFVGTQHHPARLHVMALEQRARLAARIRQALPRVPSHV